tara:strand:- start:1649 stop:2353 length:705 start_codon:yes stop_codon:yes gene_type:complete
MFKILTILIPIALGIFNYKYTAKRLAKRLEEKSSVLKEPIIGSLLKKIAHSLGVEKINIYVLEDPNLNGLVSPDGKVFITRGFLDKYYSGFVSADELVGVISHELGHLALGHTKKRMVSYTLQNTLQMGLGLVLARVIPLIGSYISAMLLRLVTAKLSRIDEYEADKYASALMIKTGLGAKPLIDLFSKLEKLTGNQYNELTWLQSHPNPKDRIDAIKKLADIWKNQTDMQVKN